MYRHPTVVVAFGVYTVKSRVSSVTIEFTPGLTAHCYIKFHAGSDSFVALSGPGRGS